MAVFGHRAGPRQVRVMWAHLAHSTEAAGRLLAPVPDEQSEPHHPVHRLGLTAQR